MAEDNTRPTRRFFLIYLTFSFLGATYVATELASASTLGASFADALTLGLMSLALFPAFLSPDWFREKAKPYSQTLARNSLTDDLSYTLIAILFAFLTTRAVVLSRPPDTLILQDTLLQTQSLAWQLVEILIATHAQIGAPVFIVIMLILMGAIVGAVRQNSTSDSFQASKLEPLAWLAIVALNPILDLSSPLLAAFLLSGTLIWLAHALCQRYPEMLPNWVYTLSIPLAWTIAQPLANTQGKGMVLNGFVLLMWALFTYGQQIKPRQRLLLAMLGIAMGQLTASTWALSLEPPGEPTIVAQAHTAAYCEEPVSERIWLAHPACFSSSARNFAREPFARCAAASLSRIGNITFDAEKTLKPFETDTPGEIHSIACSAEFIWGAAYRPAQDGQETATVFAMPLGTTGGPTFDVLGPGLGHSLLYVPASKSLYATAPHADSVHTRQYPNGVTEALTNLGVANTSKMVLAYKEQSSSYSILGADGITGQTLYEWVKEPAGARLKQTVPLHNIQATGIAVAPEANRLYVTGPWTLDSFALDTLEHLTRIRTSTSTLAPVYVPAQNIVLVTSQIEGTISIHDAESLEEITVLEVGLGASAPFVSKSGYVFISNREATFRWPLHNFLQINES